ncbi:ATP-binding protein [Streptomyces cyaneofuscatus]|nr:MULTISPECIES: ATP-binding protein [Streptomyces]WRO11853.1 ATP-binding protein [Streptomyces cyaneofuscatus]
MTDDCAGTDVRAGGDPHQAQAAPLQGPGVALPATAADARDLVREQMALGAPDPQDEEAGARVLADALLVTSELVTNAIRHGDGLTAFDLWITDDGLILNVADASTCPPVTTDPRNRLEGQVGGFGWPLVCRLARHVAVTVLPDGKQITVLISLTPPA